MQIRASRLYLRHNEKNFILYCFDGDDNCNNDDKWS